MSSIRVRRSGLIAFAIRFGSTITGLAFVLIVTRNLTQQEFGLWQLIGKTIGYTVFLTVIISFWVTRYRARGNNIGRTALIACLLYSAAAVPAYLVASYFVSSIVPPVAQSGASHTNLFFFLLSAPQVLLLTMIVVPEALLWGFKPELASVGFGIFELAKVALGVLTVAILHLSLTGAVLAVVGGEIAQLAAALAFTRDEYRDLFSVGTMQTWFRTGWVAVLNNLYFVVITFDYLIVGFFTASEILLAQFGAAAVIAGVILYGSYLASGLYASVLSGKDASLSTNQVFELQLAFVLPMTAGAVLLAPELLTILNPLYAVAANICRVLAVGSAFAAVVTTLDNLISGSDRIDASQNSNFSAYLKSRLFLLARINIFLSVGYLLSVAVVSLVTGSSSSASGDFTTLGLLWALAYSSMYILSFFLKAFYSRDITRLAVSGRTAIALVLGTFIFGIVLVILNNVIVHPACFSIAPPNCGAVKETAYFILIGAIGVLAYGGVVLTLSRSIRAAFRAVISTILGF